MKHIHKIIYCMALLTTCSVLAKIMKTTSETPANIPATRSPQPANQPAVQQPAAQVLTYKQLRDKIVNTPLGSRAIIINPQTKLLDNTFVENMIRDVKNTGRSRDDQEFVLYTLLTTARDRFFIFSLDDTENIRYLNNIEAQIINAFTSL